MIELIGRKNRKIVAVEGNLSILDLALKHSVDWGFSCTQGNCARCRCLITDGMEFLSEPSEAEEDRLEPEELAEGFRLACQTRPMSEGNIVAINKPYF